MGRLLIFLVTGLLCAIGGLFIGLSSHQVTYSNTEREIVAHFLSGGSSSSNHIGYLQMVNDANLYIVNEDDFSPPVKDNSFGDGDTISFIYRPMDTTSINVSATNTSTHMQGSAFTIEQLTVLPNGGSDSFGSQTYTSSEFSKNPKGFYQNDWLPGTGPLVLGGAVPLAVGLLLIVVGFILQLLRGRKKTQAEVNVAPPIMVEMPVSQYQQSQVYAYPQPYQNFAQYQQQYSPQPWTGQVNTEDGIMQGNQPPGQQQPNRQFQPRPGQFKSPQGVGQYNQPPQNSQYPQPQDRQ
jgi:hypothetical protein